MSNRGILDDMEFEQQLTSMGDNQIELTKFIARQQFQTGKLLLNHGRRIKNLENQSHKRSGFIGGISALVTAAIIGAIEYFRRG